jgi:4-hydroxybenzoate polyprenyltransferase
MDELKALIISLRPGQWIKNSFVVAPLLFSKKITDIPTTTRVLYGFILFCLFSSSIYLINDVIDLKNDRNHPTKNKRPLAQGTLSVKISLLSSGVLLCIAIIGSFTLDRAFFILCLVYWFSNLFYSLVSKNFVIFDVFCISFGFVLRVIAGGVLVRVYSSHWILTSTVFLSLFLGFAKRRKEAVLFSMSNEKKSRPVLKDYSIQLIDQFLVISATASIISYAMFTLSGYAFEKFGTHNLIYTIPFVIFGILRYLYLIESFDSYESPTEAIFRDKILVFNIILWVVCLAFIIYR